MRRGSGDAQRGFDQRDVLDAMAANQALSANITAFNVLKQVVAKGLEIGK